MPVNSRFRGCLALFCSKCIVCFKERINKGKITIFVKDSLDFSANLKFVKTLKESVYDDKDK